MNAEEVNNTPQTPDVSTVPQAPEGIQPGLEDRAEALGAIEQAKANLGEVAAGRTVQMDASGNILTPNEVALERQHFTEHGSSSNETATKI